jgi:hypothetical protein
MKLTWAHFTKDELFFSFSQSTMHFFRQGIFSISAMVGYQLNWSEGWKYSSADHSSGQGL